MLSYNLEEYSRGEPGIVSQEPPNELPPTIIGIYWRYKGLEQTNCLDVYWYILSLVSWEIHHNSKEKICVDFEARRVKLTLCHLYVRLYQLLGFYCNSFIRGHLVPLLAGNLKTDTTRVEPITSLYPWVTTNGRLRKNFCIDSIQQNRIRLAYSTLLNIFLAEAPNKNIVISFIIFALIITARQ